MNARLKTCSLSPLRRGGRSGAFTLIELLLAVAIFAIVIVAMNTVFFAALRLRNRTMENLEQSLPMTQALATLRQDLLNAVPPGGPLSGQFQYAPGGGSISGLSGLSSKSSAGNSYSTMIGMAGLTFCTATGTLSDYAPWADVQQVSYQLMEPLEEGIHGGRDLVRLVNRNLLGISDQRPESQRLAGGIDTLEFEFFDGLQWLDSWDTSLGQTGLPQAIRVRVYLATTRNSPVRMEPVQMTVLLEPRASSGSQSATNAVSGAPLRNGLIASR